MRLSFIYNRTFVADWHHLGLGDAEIRDFEAALMERPDAGAVMRGTGGARKTRFAPAGRGKSGAYRVVYGYFPAQAQVYAFLAFGKNDQSNLTADEGKACRQLMKEIAAYLQMR